MGTTGPVHYTIGNNHSISPLTNLASAMCGHKKLVVSKISLILGIHIKHGGGITAT